MDSTGVFGFWEFLLRLLYPIKTTMVEQEGVYDLCLVLPRWEGVGR